MKVSIQKIPRTFFHVIKIMNITTKEQIRIIDKWNTEKKSTRDLLCFYEGMEAVCKLIAEKDNHIKKNE